MEHYTKILVEEEEEEKRESLDRTIRVDPPSFNISASIIQC